MHIYKLGNLLSPDEPTAGEAAESAMAAAMDAAEAKQAGTGDGSGGAGDPTGSETATDPAPGDLGATLDKIMADAEAAEAKPEANAPKADKAEPKPAFVPISDEDIQAAAMQAGLTGVQLTPDSITATAKAATEPKAEPAAPKTDAGTTAAAPATPGISAELEAGLADLDTQAQDVEALKPYAKVIKGLTDVVKAQAVQAKALQDRLDKQDADAKAAAEAAKKANEARTEHQKTFDEKVAPILNTIDAIPDLDVARYGRFNGSQDKSQMSPQQYAARVELDIAAGVLRARWTSQGKKNADGSALTSDQIYDAAHRSLKPPAPKGTTKAAVMQDIKKQHAGRTAAGMARGSSAGRSPPIFTDKDTGPQALEKAFNAASAN